MTRELPWYNLARNTTNSKLLDFLSTWHEEDSPDDDCLLGLVAKNRYTSVKTLSFIYSRCEEETNLNDLDICYSLTLNPNTPSSILEKIACKYTGPNGDAAIQESLEKNPNSSFCKVNMFDVHQKLKGYVDCFFFSFTCIDYGNKHEEYGLGPLENEAFYEKITGLCAMDQIRICENFAEYFNKVSYNRDRKQNVPLASLHKIYQGKLT